MSIHSAYNHTEQVAQATWGHLAPKPGTYSLSFVCAHADYGGDLLIISSKLGDGLEDSPWLFEIMNDALWQAVGNDIVHQGEVSRWTGVITFTPEPDGMTYVMRGKFEQIKVW